MLGLFSKVFTFAHLFGHRSDFFNNLASFFFPLNGQKTIKIDAWALALNSEGLYFHEGIEKIKENDKNIKIENLQNGGKSMVGKTSRTCTVRAKIKIYI